MRRTATLFAIAALLSLALCPLASAGLIAADGFIVGSGGYTAGNLSGQNPTTVGFTGAWGGNTATIGAVSTGLEYPGLDAEGGAARFNYGSNLGDYPRYLTRALSAYDDTQSVYYFSGLMSFDGSLATDVPSYGVMGFVNSTRDDDDSDGLTDQDVFGVQWGFKGNGTGVDAFVRVRDFSSPTTMNEHAIAQNIAPGTHQFVIKVEPDVNVLNDALSIWFDPVSLSSEAAAGSAIRTQECMVWVPGDAGYLVDMLMLKTYSAGANAVIGFDEARMGTTWASVTPEPGSLMLLLVGVFVLSIGGRRRHR